MSLEKCQRVGGAGGPWRGARGPGRGSFSAELKVARVPVGRSSRSTATGGCRNLGLMRVPFAAMYCVASLSLVRMPSRATTSVHRAPPRPSSAASGFGWGSARCTCSAVVAGGAGDLQSRCATRWSMQAS